MSTQIKVIIVDPAAKRVRERTIASSNRGLLRILGGKPDPHYGMFPRHAVATRENARVPTGAWRLRGADGLNTEVFHGPAVMYKVEASKRVSHELSEEGIRNSIDWINNDSQEQAEQQHL